MVFIKGYTWGFMKILNIMIFDLIVGCATTWHIDDITHNTIWWFMWWWDVMRTWWWLRSTTGSYGWHMVEAAYGETIIHSTKGVWEILAQEEWLAVSTWYITHGRHTRVNTCVGTIYGIFRFYDIKIYMYYVLKIYMYIKGTLVVFDVVLARRRSENVFDCPWCF